jgi:hypothetical protein
MNGMNPVPLWLTAIARMKTEVAVVSESADPIGSAYAFAATERADKVVARRTHLSVRYLSL